MLFRFIGFVDGRDPKRLLEGPSRRELQRPFDQPAPAFFVISALDQHAIERERRGHQAPHALRDTLLGSLNAADVFLRKRFHHRQLRPREVGDAVLEATERE